MRRRLFVQLMTGALFAAPQRHPADPQFVAGSLHWFTLSESMKDVEERIGAPSNIAPFGTDFISWQYRFGGVDEHDYSHYLVFRRSTGRLVSVTRAYDPEQVVDQLFPEKSTRTVYQTNNSGAAFGARVAVQPGGVLLIAMGSTKRGVPTSQLTLIRETDLAAFLPWVGEGLAAKPAN